jgi:hypothetical protein
MFAEGDLGRLAAELDRRGVRGVVVGGVAVNMLGYARATNDLDLLVPATAEDGRTLRRALAELGATRPDGSELPAMT